MVVVGLIASKVSFNLFLFFCFLILILNIYFNCKENPCFSNPCRNGANCSPLYENPLMYTCSCPLGYSGKNCETFACSNYLCYNGGRCAINAHGRAYCICPSGFTGPQCTNSNFLS
jgi:hypothetical protein